MSTVSRNAALINATRGGAFVSGLVATPGRWAYDAPLDSINQLVEQAMKHHLDAIWVLPGTRESFLAGNTTSNYCYTVPTDYCKVRATTQDGKILCLHAYVPGGTNKDARRTIRIFFPEHDTRWGLEGITHPYHLLNAIDMVEDSLLVPLDWSPGSTGKSTFLRLNDGIRASWLRPIDFFGTPWRPTEEEQANGAIVPLSSNGTRKISPEEPVAAGNWYYHCYDKSYGFGGAMKGVNVGAGQPEYHPYGSIPWDKRLPGVWLLPSGKWMYTPEVAYLIEQDFLSPLQIQGAWIWHEYHQTMRSFADLFWGLEQTAKANPIAKKLGKEIRTVFFGWLAMDVQEFRDTRSNDIDSLYRPDIWGMVVSEMRTRMNRMINTLHAQGYLALFWNYDELGFFSKDPNPNTAVPILAHTGQCGAFRWRYTLPVDDDIFNAFNNSNVSFKTAHNLLLAKWEKQQKIYMDATLLVPAVSLNG